MVGFMCMCVQCCETVVGQSIKSAAYIVCCGVKVNTIENRECHFYKSIHAEKKWYFISEKSWLQCSIATDKISPEQYEQIIDQMINVKLLCSTAHFCLI